MGRQTETEREKDRDKQTDRQTDRQKKRRDLCNTDASKSRFGEESWAESLVQVNRTERRSCQLPSFLTSLIFVEHTTGTVCVKQPTSSALSSFPSNIPHPHPHHHHHLLSPSPLPPLPSLPSPPSPPLYFTTTAASDPWPRGGPCDRGQHGQCTSQAQEEGLTSHRIDQREESRCLVVLCCVGWYLVINARSTGGREGGVGGRGGGGCWPFFLYAWLRTICDLLLVANGLCSVAGCERSVFNRNIRPVSRATLRTLRRDGAGRVWAFPNATMPF